ncbi:unnamed protein product [Onchocerca flexuosa]|uniref:Uncharacterized protein n=1 Tax=Onchocerca flexuosa TaxID=387005 RepID=A0A183H5K9_9BILA|nr:unnamed protein product [Onchocerca flexuosa]
MGYCLFAALACITVLWYYLLFSSLILTGRSYLYSGNVNILLKAHADSLYNEQYNCQTVINSSANNVKATV